METDHGQCRAFRGTEGLWGVEYENSGILYEPDMCRQTAEAVADMNNAENPPKDWDETAARLDVAGLVY